MRRAVGLLVAMGSMVPIEGVATPMQRDQLSTLPRLSQQPVLFRSGNPLGFADAVAVSPSGARFAFVAGRRIRVVRASDLSLVAELPTDAARWRNAVFTHEDEVVTIDDTSTLLFHSLTGEVSRVSLQRSNSRGAPELVRDDDSHVIVLTYPAAQRVSRTSTAPLALDGRAAQAVRYGGDIYFAFEDRIARRPAQGTESETLIRVQADQLAVSPEGKVAYASREGVFVLGSRGVAPKKIRDGAASAIAFVEGGLLVADSDGLAIIDTKSRERTDISKGEGSRQVAVSRATNTIIYVSSRRVYVFRANELQPSPAAFIDAGPQSIVFGRAIAALTTHHVVLLSPSDGKPLAAHTAGFDSPTALVTDGAQRVWVASDRMAHALGSRPHAWRMQRPWHSSHRLAHAKGVLLCAGDERLEAFTDEGRPLWSLTTKSDTPVVAVSPDGSRVATTVHNVIVEVDAHTGHELRRRDGFDEVPTMLAYLSSDTLVASATATALWSKDGMPRLLPSASVAADPQGRYLVVRGPPGTLVLCRVTDGAPFLWLDELSEAFALSTNGEALATLTASGELLVYSLETALASRDATSALRTSFDEAGWRGVTLGIRPTSNGVPGVEPMVVLQLPASLSLSRDWKDAGMRGDPPRGFSLASTVRTGDRRLMPIALVLEAMRSKRRYVAYPWGRERGTLARATELVEAMSMAAPTPSKAATWDVSIGPDLSEPPAPGRYRAWLAHPALGGERSNVVEIEIEP